MQVVAQSTGGLPPYLVEMGEHRDDGHRMATIVDPARERVWPVQRMFAILAQGPWSWEPFDGPPALRAALLAVVHSPTLGAWETVGRELPKEPA